MTTTTIAEDNGHAATALARIATNVEGMDVRTLATLLVRSGYFQDARDLSQAVVKVLAGSELGFGPIASMQGVYIVKGRVSLASNLIAAAIQRSGRFRYRVSKLDRTGCTIKFFERVGGNWEEVGESAFDPNDATDAGLAGGDNYKHFPRNMFFARALTNGARWYCPEVFNGPVYTPDELGARVDDEGQVIEVPAAPPMDTGGDDDLPEETEQPAYVPTEEREVEDAEVVRSADETIWRRWMKVRDEALGLGVRVEELRLPIDRNDLKSYGSEIALQISQRKKQAAPV